MLLKELKPLLEEPLPPDVDPSYLEPKPGAYSSPSLMYRFTKIGGVKVGQGSSRAAFSVSIDADLLDTSILSSYGFPTSGKIDTVFKVATNANGIAQNKAEINTFKKYKSHDFARYILPILDTSARTKNITLDEEPLSHWIQLPMVKRIKPLEFKGIFEAEFGMVFDDLSNLKIKTRAELHDALKEIRNNAVKNGVASGLQAHNFHTLMDMIDTVKLGFGDIFKNSSWGLFNNRLYLLDYGFDVTTHELYNKFKKATAKVDKDGNITLKLSPTLKRYKA
jgi:hypothetical protein